MAQTESRRRRGVAVQSQGTVRPAIIIVSDRQLNRYKTERNRDFFTVTIYEVGTPRIISYGQAFEQQPQGANDLLLAFHLPEGVNPQLEQRGNELNILFTSMMPLETGFRSVPRNREMPSNSASLPPPPSQEARQVAPNFARFPAGVPNPASDDPIVAIEPISVATASNANREESDECDTIATEPVKDAPDDVLVVIDANTGKILEGNTRVSEDTRVKVAFVNKNPFKYDYNFELIPKDVGGATVVSFLGLIPGLPSIPGFFEGTIQPATTEADLKDRLAEAVSAARALNRAGLVAEDPSACTKYADDVEKVVVNGEKVAKALKEGTDLLKKAIENYTKFLKATDKTPREELPLRELENISLCVRRLRLCCRNYKRS